MTRYCKGLLAPLQTSASLLHCAGSGVGVGVGLGVGEKKAEEEEEEAVDGETELDTAGAAPPPAFNGRVRK